MAPAFLQSVDLMTLHYLKSAPSFAFKNLDGKVEGNLLQKDKYCRHTLAITSCLCTSHFFSGDVACRVSNLKARCSKKFSKQSKD